MFANNNNELIELNCRRIREINHELSEIISFHAEARQLSELKPKEITYYEFESFC